jgi:hypothetical protein
MAANCPDLPTQNGLKTEVAFTISMDALQQALADTGLPTGDLTAREARRLACDAHVLPVVMGGESQPLDVAVPAYVAPAHIKRDHRRATSAGNTTPGWNTHSKVTNRPTRPALYEKTLTMGGRPEPPSPGGEDLED